MTTVMNNIAIIRLFFLNLDHNFKDFNFIGYFWFFFFKSDALRDYALFNETVFVDCSQISSDSLG